MFWWLVYSWVLLLVFCWEGVGATLFIYLGDKYLVDPEEPETTIRHVRKRSGNVPKGYAHIEKFKGNQLVFDRNEKLVRFADNVFKFVYHSVTTSFAMFSFLLTAEWNPPLLGGPGTLDACWDQKPMASSMGLFPSDMDSFSLFISQHPIEIYYSIQMGWYIFTFWPKFFSTTRKRQKKKTDALETVLHHSCTIGLLLLSEMGNHSRVGTLILFLHDIADVLAHFAKMFSECKRLRWLFYVLYGFLVFIWAYTRLVVFSMIIANSVSYYNRNANNQNLACILLLCVLQFLHVYWFIHMIVGFTFKAIVSCCLRTFKTFTE